MNRVSESVPGSDNLEDLLERSRSGDSRAFEALVRRLQPMVFRIALGFFRDRDEALEVLQDTFLRIYRNLHRVDQSVGLQGWVFRIATNICIDRYRSRRKRGEKERGMTLLETRESAHNADPEDMLEKSDRLERLQAALDRLSDRERSVFVLKHINHLKLKEIAATLDISLGTVKSTHFRAVNHLRREVAAGGEA